MSAAPLPTLLVVPSGIGCERGGYAGDALPLARLLAGASGCLVTHPNVMNAASLYWSDQRIHYVEGYALDRFCAAELALRPRRGRRVGVLLDAGIEAQLQWRHRQVADAARASLGLEVGPVVTTDVPLGVSLRLGESGISWGGLEQPGTLLRAGESLVQAGAEAIAVVTRFPDDPDSASLAAYRAGGGVDALAGAEAVISHLLVRRLGIPCAHSPALAPLPLREDLDPRAAAEELGFTFLSCVLVGLSRAPDLIPAAEARATDLHPDALGAVVSVADALGGAGVLACAERGLPVIALRNPCALQVNAAALGPGGDAGRQRPGGGRPGDGSPGRALPVSTAAPIPDGWAEARARGTSGSPPGNRLDQPDPQAVCERAAGLQAVPRVGAEGFQHDQQGWEDPDESRSPL